MLQGYDARNFLPGGGVGVRRVGGRKGRVSLEHWTVLVVVILVE